MPRHLKKKLADMDAKESQMYFQKKFGENANLIGFFYLLLTMDRQQHPELYRKIGPKKHD